jgi:hypothetical protein
VVRILVYAYSISRGCGSIRILVVNPGFDVCRRDSTWFAGSEHENARVVQGRM